MQWTADRVHAAATGPLWSKTAIFITWDDWGGWYDHVVPPLASTWPGGGHAGYQNSQFRYGPRVPCLVVSPYARRGINHTFYSHESIVKFCLRQFALKAWNAPALLPHGKSGDMSESFDFTAAPRLGVPSAVDPTKPCPFHPAWHGDAITPGWPAKPHDAADQLSSAVKMKHSCRRPPSAKAAHFFNFTGILIPVTS